MAEPLRDPSVSPEAPTGAKERLHWLLPAATALQVVPCFFLLTLSGYRTVIGGVALFAATIAGPFEVFHQNAVRIPFFVIAGFLSLMNLYLYFFAKRRREAPSASWRKQPLSARERRIQKIQLASSVLALLMIAGDVFNHHRHGLGW
jgi:cytochrome b subunit of formate dehydrogenase